MSARVGQASLAELRRRAEAGELSDAELAGLAGDSREGARQLARRILARRQRLVDEQQRLAGMLRFEQALWRAGHTCVAGVDEVGVGPLAGPVVAAAVILPPGSNIADIDDSKRLSPQAREHLDGVIRREAIAWAVGMCSAEEIDAGNIFVATRQAARRAVLALSTPPEHILVDAYRVPQLDMPQTPLIHGDRRSQSVAAASIVAKVTRDYLMRAMDITYPNYGFAQHVGYGTARHLAALRTLGPCPEHRRSFAPVRAVAGLEADAHVAPQQMQLAPAPANVDLEAIRPTHAYHPGDGFDGSPEAHGEAREQPPGA